MVYVCWSARTPEVEKVASRVGPGPNSPEVHEGPVEGDEEFRQRRQWWWGTTRLHEALDAL
jgi:hypothetical protein